MRGFRVTGVAAAALLLASAGGSVGRAQGPMSNRCFTPRFWCWLPSFTPAGTPCYCGTPHGPVAGIVR